MLPNNKEGSLRRLATLNKKLERQELTHEYTASSRNRKKQALLSRAEHPSRSALEFYIPHKPVVRATAESVKLHIVYDASARAFHGAPSLKQLRACGSTSSKQTLERTSARAFQPRGHHR